MGRGNTVWKLKHHRELEFKKFRDGITSWTALSTMRDYKQPCRQWVTLMVPKANLIQSHTSVRSLCRLCLGGVRMRLAEKPGTVLGFDITHGMDNDPMKGKGRSQEAGATTGQRGTDPWDIQ